MYLERKANRVLAKSHIRFDNLADYIGMLIDVYSSTSVQRDCWLTNSERKFFIATIIHVSIGYTNPISEESVQIYKQYFNPKVNNKNIADYLNKLRLKEWLTYDPEVKKVEIADVFKKIDLNSDMFDISLRFLYESRN